MPTSYNFNLIDNEDDQDSDVRVMSNVPATVTSEALNLYEFAIDGVEEVTVTGTSGPVWFWPTGEDTTLAQATAEFAERTADTACAFKFTGATGLGSDGAGAIGQAGPYKKPIKQVWVVSDSGAQTVTVMGVKTVSTP